jgi:hypothetical protein
MAQMAQQGGFGGGMPGAPGPAAGEALTLTGVTKEELIARRKKAKESRKARKKQRR